MAYKNQKKNKQHNKELHATERKRKQWRERARNNRNTPAPSIEQMMRQAGLI